MTKKAFIELEQAIQRAAASAYGCDDPEEIGVELDEQYLTKDGRPSVLVNWSQSMKATSEVREAVKEAVRAALPESYQRYHVQLL